MSLRQVIAELERQKSITDRTTPDGERMYLYFDRKLQETRAIKAPLAIYSQDSVAHTDEDGTVWFKPPRSMHSSRTVRLLDRITRWIDPRA
jgi:hypothetical protein